jgi:transcriptional regulator with XRE-family HTH domain
MPMARGKEAGAVESGNRIRAVRKGKGMSARELADRMTEAGHKFSYTAITKIENNQRTLHEDTLHVIAKVLGVPPDSLLDDSAPTQKVPVVPAEELIDTLVSGQEIDSEHEIAVVSDGRLVGLTGLRTELGDGIIVADLSQKEMEPGFWLVSEKGRLHVDEVVEGDYSKEPPASVALVGYIVGVWKPLDQRIPYRDVQKSDAEKRHDEEEGVDSFIRRRLKPK